MRRLALLLFASLSACTAAAVGEEAEVDESVAPVAPEAAPRAHNKGRVYSGGAYRVDLEGVSSGSADEVESEVATTDQPAVSESGAIPAR